LTHCIKENVFFRKWTGVVMKHRDGIFATVAVALSSLALAGIVHTDEFSQAASAEAKGYDALAHEVLRGEPAADAARPAVLEVMTADAGKVARQ
jgi:hypothetical protein